MNRKPFIAAFITASIFLLSCGGNPSQAPAGNTPPPVTETAKAADDTKGVGKFTNVELTHPLDDKMIKQGEGIYDLKCSSCHKLSTEKLVGPGWKGVTDRRKPEWIMNFATNTDEMLDKDANAKALLEVCMVRMPNQNLKDDEARSIVEFMRKNDGKN